MNKGIAITAIMMAAGLGVDSAAAQRTLDTQMRGVTITGLIGGAAYTDFQRVAEPTATAGPLRRITAETSPVLGVAIGVWPSRHWGLRFHASFAPTRLELRDGGETIEEQETVESRFPGSSVDVWTADLAFMVRAPVTPGGRVVPYFLLGGGILGFSAERGGAIGPARVLEKDPVRPAAMVGLGALVALQRDQLALTFELTDHIFSTPIREDPQTTLLQPAGDQVGVTSQIRLLTGITLRVP